LGDVIIDALHEFSNIESLLPPERRSQPPTAADREEGFVNPSEWGLDDALGDFLNEKKEVAPAAPAAPAAPSPPPKPPPPRRQQPPATSAASRRPPAKPTEDGPWWKKWWG
jgi:hypothetical protein